MRRVGVVVQCLAVAWMASPCRAQSTEGLPPPDFASRFDGNVGATDVAPHDAIAFVGGDGWRNGASAYAGAEWTSAAALPVAPIARLFGAVGHDRFESSVELFRTTTLRASLLAGIRWQHAGLDLKLFAGPDILARSHDPQSRELQNRPIWGARIAVDAWLQPATSWMVSGQAALSSIESGATLRIASGLRVLDVWLGPEVQINHDVHSTQWRAGLHITGLRWQSIELSAAGGYLADSYRRDGAYGRLGVIYRP